MKWNYPIVKFLFATICFSVFNESQAQVAINEIMASNSETIVDEDGDYEDWIELYNYSDQPVNLQGFGLSDTYDEPWRWAFPDITLASGEILLVWASGKDRSSTSGPLHTNFSISQHGEEVLLTSADGEVPMDEYAPTSLPAGTSLGRYPDGTGDLYFFDNPTPGEPNGSDGYQEFLEPPTFSVAPGFYPGTVTLELEHDDPDVTIHYTTDGSEPDESAMKYENEPIELTFKGNEPNQHSMTRTSPGEWTRAGGWIAPSTLIDKAHTIRAVAIQPGSHSSMTATGTWFPEMEQNEITVLSLVSPHDGFFGDDNGIYVPGTPYIENGWNDNSWVGSPNANYWERGDESERETSLEWFEGGEQKFQQNVGIRIHGGHSRVLPMKALRVYARGSYGQTHINYPVFYDEPYSEYERLILRNGGQGFWSPPMRFRDPFNHQLARNLNVRTSAYRPAAVFLNGEYWGLHNIRERFDKRFFERVYEVPPDQLDLLRRDGRADNNIKMGDNSYYKSMISFIEQNELSEPGNYAQLSGMMDIENYADYIILQTYVANQDWPNNNIDYWRYSGTPDPSVPEKDGRWRWVLYDVDLGFAWNRNDDWLRYLIHHTPSIGNPEWSTFLFRSLLNNDDFKRYFINRYSDLLNTTFRANNVRDLIDEMADEIRTGKVKDFERWSVPSNMGVWEDNVNAMKNFANTRSSITWGHLRNTLDAGSNHPVEITLPDPGAGFVRLNTLEIGPHKLESDSPDTYMRRGRYFQNIPIRIEAVPASGYSFARWEINGEGVHEIQTEVHVTEETDIIAHFDLVEDFDDAFPAPFVFEKSSTYSFEEWEAMESPGSFPGHMAFVYMDETDPGLKASIDGFTTGVYNLVERTRINGLGENGFSFINTSNLEDNYGYPGRRLGGAILALDTRNTDVLSVSWTAGTVAPNSREYAIRLQYRIGNEGPFYNVPDSNGNPVEYIRNENTWHSSNIGPVMLPSYITGKPYIQLFWRYYYTGIRYDEDSGARSQLNISSIHVDSEQSTFIESGDNGEFDDKREQPQTYQLNQNYPNPFNAETMITFQIPQETSVTLAVYDITGRYIVTLADGNYSEGVHQVRFNTENLSSGIYLYHMQTPQFAKTGKMILVK